MLDSAGRVVQVTETEGQYMFNGSDLPEGFFVVVATDTNGNQTSLKLKILDFYSEFPRLRELWKISLKTSSFAAGKIHGIEL